MPKCYVLISNSKTFEGAVRALSDSGPLDSIFSTPSIELKFHPSDAFDKAKEAFPEHRVFNCRDLYAYFYDERGNPCSPWDSCKDEADEG